MNSMSKLPSLVDDYVNNSKELSNVVSLLTERKVKAYYFGGFLRSLLFGEEIKDVDIIVDVTEEQLEELKDKLGEQGWSNEAGNEYSGKLSNNGVFLDIWSFEDHFETTLEKNCKLSNLPRTLTTIQNYTAFNCQSILMDVYVFENNLSRCVHTNENFLNFYHTSVVELVAIDSLISGYTLSYGALKGLMLCETHNYGMGPKLQKFILECFENMSMEDFAYTIREEVLKHRWNLSTRMVFNIVQGVCKRLREKHDKQ